MSRHMVIEDVIAHLLDLTVAVSLLNNKRHPSVIEYILVVVRQQALSSEHLETQPALLGAITAQSLASMLAVTIAGSLAAAVPSKCPSFNKLFVYRLNTVSR